MKTDLFQSLYHLKCKKPSLGGFRQKRDTVRFLRSLHLSFPDGKLRLGWSWELPEVTRLASGIARAQSQRQPTRHPGQSTGRAAGRRPKCHPPLIVLVSVTQLYPTLCDPMDCSPPGSSVHGLLQARVLEWAAIPFSGDLPDPGIKATSPALQADSLPSEPQGSHHWGRLY